MEESEKQGLCSLMRVCLEENFEHYSEDHTVEAGSHGNRGVWLVYCVGSMNTSNMMRTLRFDLNIREDNCHIAWFIVPEKLRRRGIGTQLYGALEEFCRKKGLTKIEVDASGEEPKFYEVVGMKSSGSSIEMVKYLK